MISLPFIRPYNFDIKRLFPFLLWLPLLRQWTVVRGDLVAGFTVAMMSIPQSMAYANLAGVPITLGLYAAFIPTIVAALFGSSRALSTGPVPVTSLLTATALLPLAAVGSAQYSGYAIYLCFLAGILQILFSLFRFGIILNFISYPVMLGFTNAVCIMIALMQLGNLLGIYSMNAPHYYQTVWQVISDAIAGIYWPNIGMAGLTLTIILLGRRFFPKWPHTFIAVVVTTVLAAWTDYESLENISAKQIINLPIQTMLQDNKTYLISLEHLQFELELEKYQLAEANSEFGAFAEETRQLEKKTRETGFAIEQLMRQHQFELTELKRARLRRLVTPHHEVVYFQDNQMSPIGKVDPHFWHIKSFPSADRILLQGGGDIVGPIQGGLPAFQWVNFDLASSAQLFMGALIIALAGFTEALTVAKRIATQSRQRLNVNQELMGQGLAKLVGSFFQSMPVSGSFSRSAVNYFSGAKTAFASVITGLIVMVVLLWFTRLFYFLPYATLAAIILVGALGLVDFKEWLTIWKVRKRETFISILTFTLTLFLAPRIAPAILLGMVLSLSIHLYETMKPGFKELYQTPEGTFLEVNAEHPPPIDQKVSVVRFYGSLYFVNAAYFEEKILQLIAEKNTLQHIILDCSNINKMDASGLEALKNILKELQDAHISLWFSRLREPVLALIKRSELYPKIAGQLFLSNELALEALRADASR